MTLEEIKGYNLKNKMTVKINNRFTGTIEKFKYKAIQVPDKGTDGRRVDQRHNEDGACFQLIPLDGFGIWNFTNFQINMIEIIKG
jgi:hypothetical protein